MAEMKIDAAPAPSVPLVKKGGTQIMNQFIGSRALPDLVYHRPDTMDDLLGLVKGIEGEYRVVAGCTDFIPAIRGGKWRFADGINVVDIRGVKALSGIREENGEIVLGAATRLSDILGSPLIREKAPVLADAVSQMASPQVRNTATVGGNLCMASPAADTAPPLLVLDAAVAWRTAEGEESTPLNKFFLGPGATVLPPRSVLTEIRFPVPGPDEAVRRTRMGQRTAFVCSIISVAVWLKESPEKIEAARIAMGAVAPTPIRIAAAEAVLTGKKPDEATLAEAAKTAAAHIAPIDDLRASAEYRKSLAETLTRRLLAACVEDLA